ncbi:MAG: T9SS type A sorting domain-containing protein, partial [Aliifodinibius sp.]|nr:T9SS type A sorting domain-containing protein [Fodinibius sp.]NIV16534.1 T9SS type A sorting domain-containing protein [Fodinibius sp.]NIY30485.1 T9SS type A sorting domain-containing protein [Fodinibius sp.]
FQIADFGFVSLKVYDIAGREVATIVSENLAAGIYEYEWDAGDQASGIYMYRLEAGSFRQTKKLVLLK